MLVPGAALAELAARAGAEAGCGLVRDLLIDVPLALPVRGAVQVRVIVEPPGETRLSPAGAVLPGRGDRSRRAVGPARIG